MTNVKQIKSLKEKYLIDREKIKKELEPQQGISVFIEYDYLLNTDLNWIVGEIRSSIMKWIKYESKSGIENIEKKRLILTFDIDQVKTEKSIELIITPGIIDPYIVNYLIGVAGSLTVVLIVEGFRRLREKRLSKRMRANIRRIRVTKITIRGDEIEYSKREEDSFTIED